MSKTVSFPIGTLGDTGGKSEIRIRVLAEHGRHKVDLRTFDRMGLTAGLYAPTKAGIAIEVEDVAALCRLLQAAVDALDDLGAA